MSDRQERIRKRAHAYWEEEGCPVGHDKDHWERAEAEIDRENAASFDDYKLATGTAGSLAGVQPSDTNPGGNDPATDKAAKSRD